MLNNIKITDIKKTKKGLNALFCDGGFLFSVDDLALYQNHIEIGSRLSQIEVDGLAKQSTMAKATDKCYTLLGLRMHGKRELQNKLLKFFDADTAAAAVDKMEEMGLIDDEKFAAAKADYMINVKNSSLMGTKMKLLSLGIDKDIVDNVLLNFDESQEDTIRDIIEKKYASKLVTPEKVVAALMRKGFKYGEIKRVLEQFDIQTEDY